MCSCNSTYDVRCLCTPDDATWDRCPEKLRYTQYILENTCDMSGLNIHVSDEYNTNKDPRYILENQRTIDDIKHRFRLSTTEFDELLDTMMYEYAVDN